MKRKVVLRLLSLVMVASMTGTMLPSNIQQALHYLEAAEQKGLFVTCGSDFHGKNKPNIVLGGHNALWSDERLTSELKKCSLWKLPVL